MDAERTVIPEAHSVGTSAPSPGLLAAQVRKLHLRVTMKILSTGVCG